MGAVHADPWPWVDVQLPVDDHMIAGVDRDVCRQGRVVVNLQHLAGRGLDVEPLVPTRFDRVVEHCGVERNLSAVALVDDVSMEFLVVNGCPFTASP